MPEENNQDSETVELRAYFDEDDDSDGLNYLQEDLKQMLSQIGVVIDCLLPLSVTISNPDPHDSFKSRTGSQYEFYEPWDIQHVRTKYPHLAANAA